MASLNCQSTVGWRDSALDLGTDLDECNPEQFHFVNLGRAIRWARKLKFFECTY